MPGTAQVWQGSAIAAKTQPYDLVVNCDEEATEVQLVFCTCGAFSCPRGPPGTSSPGPGSFGPTRLSFLTYLGTTPTFPEQCQHDDIPRLLQGPQWCRKLSGASTRPTGTSQGQTANIVRNTRTPS